MSSKGTLDTITRHLSYAVQPLREAVQDLESFQAFLYSLGWEADSLPQQFVDLAIEVDQVITAINALVDEPTLPEVQVVVNEVKDLYDAIKAVNSVPSGISAGDMAAFLAEISGRIMEYLLVTYIQIHWAKIYRWLALLGIVETTHVPPAGNRPRYTRQKFNFDRVADLVSDPKKIPEIVYGWGTHDLNFNRLILNLAGLFDAIGIRTTIPKVDPKLANGYGLVANSAGPNSRYLDIPIASAWVANVPVEIHLGIYEYRPDNGDLPGIIVQPIIPNSVGASIDFSDVLSLAIRANTNLSDLLGLVITPDGVQIKYPFQPGNLLPQAGFGANLDYHPATPAIIFGNPDATRLQLAGAEFGLGIDYLGGDFEIELLAKLRDMALVLKGGDGDGFLAKILGDSENVIDIPLELSWSNTKGFHFKGGAGFDIQLAKKINLGPLTIEGLRLAVKAPAGSNPPKLKLETGANLRLELGPFTALVENVGASMDLTFEDGNMGPFGMKVGFKPPTGIGLALNSDSIKGGGFLSFDYDNERYAGVLELTIKDKISVKAIGLLTTRMPDGSKGFSLLLMITAEFTPIQLGFGFTLSGVGGIIGVNRTMVLDALREGVRTNSLDNVLFPQDVVENANQIITDLRTIFPPEEGRFSFGPMAQIGWGTPTLLTMEVGLMIELPSPVRIALLGVIKALLPDEAAPLIKLQVNFLGTIDFEKKFITFDASLFDSKLLNWTLEGDMAVRIKWGDNSNFVFTVGGFHPSYTPPPLGLPTMRRLTLNLLGGDNPRLTLTSYFAVTSNTVQFGAGVDFYAKVISKVTVKGYMRFDALFQFSPFYFIITFEASLAVYWKSKSVMSLFLSVLLEGPTPWHAKGRAEFRVMGIKCKLKFDKTWGQNADTSLPDVAVLPKLKEALTNKANWLASPAATQDGLITLRNMDTVPAGEVIAHPDSIMSVSQKVVPLDVNITQFSNQKPSDYTKFSLDLEDINGNPFDDQDVKEEFAPASYFSLSKNEKLSRPSFEKYNGGLSVKGTDELNSDYFRERNVEYEHIRMDSRNMPIYETALVSMVPREFNAFVRNGSSARSPLGSKARMVSPLVPAKVSLASQDYAVVMNDDLSVFEGRMASSHAEAERIVAEVLAERPGLTNQIQVVPAFEIA